AARVGDAARVLEVARAQGGGVRVPRETPAALPRRLLAPPGARPVLARYAGCALPMPPDPVARAPRLPAPGSLFASDRRRPAASAGSGQMPSWRQAGRVHVVTSPSSSHSPRTLASEASTKARCTGLLLEASATTAAGIP